MYGEVCLYYLYFCSLSMRYKGCAKIYSTIAGEKKNSHRLSICPNTCVVIGHENDCDTTNLPLNMCDIITKHTQWCIVSFSIHDM